MMNKEESQALSAAAVVLKKEGMHAYAEVVTRLHLRLDGATDQTEFDRGYQDGFVQGRVLGQRQGRDAALLEVVGTVKQP